MAEYRLNTEKNGIEIIFGCKPEQEVLTKIKAAGFRYSAKQKIWYAKQTEDRLALTKEICGENVDVTNMVTSTEKVSDMGTKAVVNLWNITRTDAIVNQFETRRLYDKKQIAKECRDHLKNRFKCIGMKLSITSDINSIHVELKESILPDNSEALNALVHYIYTYIQSYNYNHSDSYSDYVDVNFYGCYESSIAYYYNQKESEKTAEIVNLFNEKLAEFNKAEEIRKAAEFEEYMKQRAIEEAEYQKREEQRRIDEAAVIAGTEVKDVEPYFILNLSEPSLNKNDTIEEYEAQEEKDCRKTNARISRELHMTEEAYQLFAHLFLSDFDFLSGFGGSNTDDNRIGDHSDFSAMSEEERKTVEWYSDNAVAVYVGGELKIVVDPQGYDYARYVLLKTNETKVGKYECKQTLSGAEYEALKENVSKLLEADEAGMIIEDYNLFASKSLEESGAIITNAAIAQMPSGDAKDRIRECVKYMRSAPYQFDNCGLEYGDEITMFVDGSGFGLPTAYRCKYVSHFTGKYAQYDNAVFLDVDMGGRRGTYRFTITPTKCIIIARGSVTIPESVFYDISTDAGMVIKKSKFLSCSNEWFDSARAYFRQENVEVVVDCVR